jgi:hypothetical protein
MSTTARRARVSATYRRRRSSACGKVSGTGMASLSTGSSAIALGNPYVPAVMPGITT